MKKLFFFLTFIAFATISLSAQSSINSIEYISYSPKGVLTEVWKNGKEIKVGKSTPESHANDNTGSTVDFIGNDGSIYVVTFLSVLEGRYLSSIEKFDQWMNPLYRQVCQYEPKWLSFKSESDSSIIKINLSPLVLRNYQIQESKADGSAYWETGDESPYDIETTNGKIVAIRDTRTDIWYNRLD